jgi:L-xylulokinase
MGAARYLLGIDNGSTVTKAALYDLGGRELAVSAVKSDMVFPHPGHAEKDVDALWAANAKVIGDVIRRAAVAAADIAAVAVTGHGNGMYLTTADGRPAHNGINSADSRATSYVERWYSDGTFARVLPRICQPIWAGQPAALLAWFRDNDPAALERARWIFMCKDYIRFRLTGEAFGELTDYSGLSLMNVRDFRYDPEILTAYGLQGIAAKLPPVRRSTDICGQVTRAAAAETGLREGTPVAGGMFDITACAIATGITDTEKLCLIAGSWSINEFISPVPIQHPDWYMSTAYCMPGFWLIAENSPTSASNLEWFVSELMQGEGRDARERGGSVFQTCNELVSSVAPGDCDVLFLPFLYGSNAGPRASASFLGLHGWHTKAHMLRAVYEGVAFSHRTHVDRLLGVRPPARAARIAGGAAKSSVWLQIFADVLQLPIEITACEELGAMGAAMAAGVGIGCFSSFEQAAAAMVRVTRVVEPDPRAKAVYDGKYERYKAVIAALGRVWDAPTPGVKPGLGA